MHSPMALTAQQIMTKKSAMITFSPDDDVHEVIDSLLKHHLSGAPVVDEDGQLIGMFSERDCMSVIVEGAYYDMPTNRVAAFMSTDLCTIDPDRDLVSIVHLFKNSTYRRLPVVDEQDRLLGQVTRADVLRACESLLKPEQEHKSVLMFFSATRDRSEAPVT